MEKPTGGFELRDHTADIALYVWGDALPCLFRAAADGLYATIGELHALESRGRCDSLRLHAPDAESLLHDFLAELHFRFETKGVILTDVEFRRLDETTLDATARESPIDRDRSIFDREVKAVTMHDVRIERHCGRYEVTLILDI